MSKPEEWVNDWAEWRAQNANGWWTEFKEKPELHEYAWIRVKGKSECVKIESSNPDWRDTLEKRERVDQVAGTQDDPVNSPGHYQLFPGMEAIDVIRASLTFEEFAGYCKGNALKYRLRAGRKGDAEEDIAKAEWYRQKLYENVVDWTGADESRADVIGQNGNTGEHYERGGE